MQRRVLVLLSLAVVVTLFAVSCGSSSDDTSSAEDDSAEAPADDDSAEAPADDDSSGSALQGELVGLFSIDATVCDTADVSGSYFRMIQPDGTLEEGAFVPNADSPCADGSFSALAPGTDGGLLTNTQQIAPDPAFDDAGNGLAAGLVEPVKFFGVDFALAIDGEATPPTITATDTTLTGDLSGWTAYYADLVFNQGAPKPDGALPALTREVSGTIDLETGAYTLEWSSAIVGGSFNDFTGVWHLEGTFTPSS